MEVSPLQYMVQLLPQLLQDHPWLTLLAVYFLPTVVSAFNPNSKTSRVFLLNLLGGWTVLLWLVALMLALSGTERAPQKIETMAQHKPAKPGRCNKRSDKGFVVGKYVEPTVHWWKNLP